MSKDPAFLFYPGDYLRDTQCLSEAAQVAYDRLMCEHMRSIRVAKERLDFFTKRLNASEKIELMSVLSQDDKGFFIEWLSLSIEKRKAYSDSRRENGLKKYNKHMQSIRSAQEDENEIENESKRKNESKRPELEEVKAVCRDKGFPAEAEKFFDYYESNGWRVGKNPMKNWRSAVANWIRQGQNFGTVQRHPENAKPDKNCTSCGGGGYAPGSGKRCWCVKSREVSRET